MIKKAFTLPEVLLTLVIIGIIAAIVIPSLMSDIYDKAWETKRAALFARITNAITSMETVSGYVGEESADDETKTQNTDASLVFVVQALSKTYKIKNICAPSQIDKCFNDYSFFDLNGNQKTLPLTFQDAIGSGFKHEKRFNDLKATGIETLNGEKIMVYYNPYCENLPSTLSNNSKSIYFVSQIKPSPLCVNFIYDLNGEKKPNQVGRDVGAISVFKEFGNNNIKVVSPPYKEVPKQRECLEKEYYIPDIFEVLSLELNTALWEGLSFADSSTVVDSDITKIWRFIRTSSLLEVLKMPSTPFGLCVKK